MKHRLQIFLILGGNQMFFPKRKQLLNEIETLKKENTVLRHQIKESRKLSKQWENFLSYDGTRQGDTVDEN